VLVALLERTEHGGMLRRARLIGDDSDQQWHAEDEPVSPLQAAEQLASWLAERARAAEGRGASISMLVLDLDGAACSWVTSPSADPRAVEALVRQGAGEYAGSTSPAMTLGADAEIPGAASIQPLRERREQHSPRDRLAVVAMPDAAARVVIDQLDRLGVRVGAVVSFWHAVALAWDPSADPTRAVTRAGDHVVADDAPVGAHIVIDPSGRLVWAWSKRGAVLAAGVTRLLTDDDAVQVGHDDVGRLAAEWLAWAAQLGFGPTRVSCVVPPLDPPDGALSNEALGEALTRAWPNAAIDLAVRDDPVADTLLAARAHAPDADRLASDPARSMTALSGRPGRAHRGLFRWLGAALVVASVAAGIGAWRAAAAASAARTRAAEVRAEYDAAATAYVDPQIQQDHGTIAALQDAAQKERAKLEAGKREASLMPVLRELDTVSLVLGSPDVEIREITLEQLRAAVVVTVPDIKAYEDLRSAMRDIGGSSVQWEGHTEQEGGRIRVRFTGTWIEPERSP